MERLRRCGGWNPTVWEESRFSCCLSKGTWAIYWASLKLFPCQKEVKLIIVLASYIFFLCVWDWQRRGLTPFLALLNTQCTVRVSLTGLYSHEGVLVGLTPMKTRVFLHLSGCSKLEQSLAHNRCSLKPSFSCITSHTPYIFWLGFIVNK